MTRHVLGVFSEVAGAARAVEALMGDGVPESRISVLRWEESNPHGEELLEYEYEERTEAIGAGFWGGGALGGIAGLLAGAVSIIAAPVGAIAVLGSLSSALGGAAMGAAVGGFVGSLTRIGLTPDDAEHLLERLERGALIVAVGTPTAEAGAVADRLAGLGAVEIKTA